MDNTTTPEFNSVIDNIARIFVLMSLFFLALSPTLNNLYFIGAIICLFGGKLAEKLRFSFHFKMNWLLLVLLALLAAGIFFNPYGLKEGLNGFWKYAHRFIAVFLLMPLFIDAKWRRRAISTLLLSATISSIIFIIQQKHFINIQELLHQHHNLIAPLYFGIFTSLTAFICAHRFMDEKKFRWVYVLLALLFMSTIFLVNKERTGMVVFFTLVLLFGWQRFGIKGLLGGIAAACILLALAADLSPAVYKKLDITVKNIAHYSQKADTSVGIRIDLFRYGSALVAKKPLTGYGTGTFTRGIDSWLPNPTLHHYRTNPENSYLHMALQIGIIGLLVFLAWIIMQLVETRKLEPTMKRYAQGLILAMVIANALILAFYLNKPASLYFTLLPILFAGPKSLHH